MKLHRQAHVVYKTQYHLVWVTRYRRKILVPGMAEYFKKVLREVREFHADWFSEEVGVDRDHVHLHLVIPPKYAVSKVVETLKSVTSRRLKEKFPHYLAKVYWDGGGVWARGLFASTVGINETTIRQDVRHQGEQETGQAQLELEGDPACKGGVLHYQRICWAPYTFATLIQQGSTPVLAMTRIGRFVSRSVPHTNAPTELAVYPLPSRRRGGMRRSASRPCAEGRVPHLPRRCVPRQRTARIVCRSIRRSLEWTKFPGRADTRQSAVGPRRGSEQDSPFPVMHCRLA